MQQDGTWSLAGAPWSPLKFDPNGVRETYAKMFLPCGIFTNSMPIMPHWMVLTLRQITSRLHERDPA